MGIPLPTDKLPGTCIVDGTTVVPATVTTLQQAIDNPLTTRIEIVDKGSAYHESLVFSNTTREIVLFAQRRVVICGTHTFAPGSIVRFDGVTLLAPMVPASASAPASVPAAEISQ
jgi:hypothetical protein